MANIALITCRVLPEPDFDEELLVEALREAGNRVELMSWDGDGADASGFDLSVFRSCWNYYEAPDRFLDWIAEADGKTKLANEARTIRWNIHKSYLRELRDGGVGIVPTDWFERGASVDLAELMERYDWTDVVVKPAISAGSYLTRRFGRRGVTEGQAYLEANLAERDMMVQQFMPSVESGGEKALVWIDGIFTHGVSKEPRYADGVEEVSEAQAVTDEELAAGARAISLSPGDLLYGRVDLMRDDRTGELLVSEVELMEPSLFLLQHRPALERFTAAITRCASAGT